MTAPDNNLKDTEDNKNKKEESHESVATGKAAIEAGKMSNPADDATTKAKEEEDTEKWRNEG